MFDTTTRTAAATSAYEQLIAALVNNSPAGFGNAGQIQLDQHQLAIVLACIDDIDVMEQVLQDKHCLRELRNAVEPAGRPDDLEGALGAILLGWMDVYAQARVFDDVQAEVRRREAEADEDDERHSHAAPSHGMSTRDFAEVGL